MTYITNTSPHRPARSRRHLRILAALAAALLFGTPQALAAAYTGAITKHPTNSRYFMHGSTCQAIYLAGTHHRNNIQDVGPTDPPALFDFAGTYPAADAPRANFIRGWHWEHSRWERDPPLTDDWISPLPFARTGPGNAYDGKLKFNVNSYNGTYTQRLQSRAATAQNESTFLSLMLFQGFSVQSLDPGEFPHLNHPLQATNNVNGINGDWNTTTNYPALSENHTNIAGKPAAITTSQDNYVRHMVASLNGYTRLIWEVSNESNKNSLAWHDLVAGVIRNREASLTNKHLVWISHPQGVNNVLLFGSSADVVSPSKNEEAVTATGGTAPGTLYQTDPPVTSGSKIVILDTDHLGANCSWCNTAWVWKAFTRGYHVALLDDIGDYATQRANVRRGINDTLGYANKIRLIDMAPQREGPPGTPTTPCSTQYCLYTSNDPDPVPYAPAVPNGKQYLVFKPGTPTSVTIYSLPAGTYTGEWIRASTSVIQPLASFTHPGGDKTFTSPWGADAALWIANGSSYLCPK